jgi:hypothetical protein
MGSGIHSRTAHARTYLRCGVSFLKISRSFSGSLRVVDTDINIFNTLRFSPVDETIHHRGTIHTISINMYRPALTAIAAVSSRRAAPALATTAAYFSNRHAVQNPVNVGLGLGSTSSSSSTTTARRLFATGSEATADNTALNIPKPPTSHHSHTPLPNAHGSMIYTETDEAPALATYSLYPVISKVRT